MDHRFWNNPLDDELQLDPSQEGLAHEASQINDNSHEYLHSNEFHPSGGGGPSTPSVWYNHEWHAVPKRRAELPYGKQEAIPSYPSQINGSNESFDTQTFTINLRHDLASHPDDGAPSHSNTFHANVNLDLHTDFIMTDDPYSPLDHNFPNMIIGFASPMLLNSVSRDIQAFSTQFFDNPEPVQQQVSGIHVQHFSRGLAILPNFNEPIGSQMEPVDEFVIDEDGEDAGNPPYTYVPWNKPRTTTQLLVTAPAREYETSSQSPDYPANLEVADNPDYQLDSCRIVHARSPPHTSDFAPPSLGSSSRQFIWDSQTLAEVNSPVPSRRSCKRERRASQQIRNAGGQCHNCKRRKTKCDLRHTKAQPSTTTSSTSSEVSSYAILTPGSLSEDD